MDLISRHYFEQSEKDKANTKTKTPQDGASKRAVTPAAREQVFGLTIPLLTTATGEKFGKSVGNPVWLDERMTSVFDFYQVSTPLRLSSCSLADSACVCT